MELGGIANELLSIPAGLWTEAYEDRRKEAIHDLEALQAELHKSNSEVRNAENVLAAVKNKLKLTEARMTISEAALAKAKDNVATLRAALIVLSTDMHNPSTRPCSTCKKVSDALGELAGCEKVRAQMEERLAREAIAKVKGG